MLNTIIEEAEQNIKKYAEEYEIILEQSHITQVDSQNNDLSFAKEEIIRGIGIRVLFDKKMGFAYTTDMNQIEDTAKKAYLNAKLNEKDEHFSFAQKTDYPKIKDKVDKKNKDLDLDEITSFMKNILNTVNDNECAPTSGEFSKSYSQEIILNSNGVYVEDEGTYFGAYVSVNAEKDGELSSAYDVISSRNYDELNGEKLANDVSSLARDSIGGVKVDTEDTNVVLDYHAAIGILSTFISGFSGESVERGRSVLGDKVGEVIVNENLSIYDDGTYNGGNRSSKADSEGTASQRTELVKDGVLKNFIYDIYNANKANKKSTGNGFRNFSSTPSVGLSNLIFDFKDTESFEDINKGVLATNVLGAHTANPITGDFSLEVSNGFIINDGERDSPVRKAMISGNVYDILKKCNAIDSEIKQYGSFIIPKIVLPDLRVIG